ncbi:YdcF family protein [Luteibacter aegosomaticola]|uniref:YdcF family protein n=1 Tax=Luteibacter aegosomaticola TaxID=2911538 RepID=UPI001FF7A97B|nr:YdcF family protein [Luteibacter aegosomaticola]UPG92056.1 YdcF family protein [Luteibacter aegosomaticola]
MLEFIVTLLLHPAVQALLLGLFAVACVWRRKPRAGLAAGILAVAWIWVASTPALALRLREGLVSTTPAAVAHADAIVVLGGGIIPKGPWQDSGSRAGTGLTLWQEGYAPLMLVSGSDQAHKLARGYQRLGVPASDLRVDDTSTNTHENARNTAALLRAGGLGDVLLVTSPIHMRRAAAAFRHEGIDVAPTPADDDDQAALAASAGWLPRRSALTLTARCLREYVALWVYSRRGWI